MSRALRWAGVAAWLTWWAPSIALAAGARLGGLLRFVAVLRVGRMLMAVGLPATAAWFYGREIARTERRARALAGRR